MGGGSELDEKRCKRCFNSRKSEDPDPVELEQSLRKPDADHHSPPKRVARLAAEFEGNLLSPTLASSDDEDFS